MITKIKIQKFLIKNNLKNIIDNDSIYSLLNNNNQYSNIVMEVKKKKKDQN